MIKRLQKRSLSKLDFVIMNIFLAICFFCLGSLTAVKLGIYGNVTLGNSMEETLQDGTKLLFVGANIKKIVRGDIVSIIEYDDIQYRAQFSPSEQVDMTIYGPRETIHILKRVIGLPNETIRIAGDKVYIDSRLLEEPYALYQGSGEDDILVRLGENEFFLMGDNRNDSIDSRHIGPIPKENIRSVLIGSRN